jgi:hypothetical protein
MYNSIVSHLFEEVQAHRRLDVLRGILSRGNEHGSDNVGGVRVEPANLGKYIEIR